MPAHEAGAAYDCYTHFPHSFVRSLIVDSRSVATRGPTLISGDGDEGPGTATIHFREVIEHALGLLRYGMWNIRYMLSSESRENIPRRFALYIIAKGQMHNTLSLC